MLHEARLGHAVDTAQCMPLVEEISESVFRNPGALVSLARLKTVCVRPSHLEGRRGVLEEAQEVASSDAAAARRCGWPDASAAAPARP